MAALNSNVVSANEMKIASPFITWPWKSHGFTNILVDWPLKLAQVQGERT